MATDATQQDTAQEQAFDPAALDEEALLTWSADEFVSFERGRYWYIVMGVAIVVLIGISIWLQSILGAILFGLVGIIVFLFASRKPVTHTIRLMPTGVFVDQTFYAYGSFQSFWIHYQADFQELSLQAKGGVFSSVRVQLGEMDPVEVRAILIQVLPEVEEEISLIDSFARRLKL